MKTWALKTRILVSFLLAGLLPMLVMAVYSRYQAASALKEALANSFEAQRSVKVEEVKRYFKNINDQMLIMAHNPMIIEATSVFKEAFSAHLKDNKISASQLENMKKEVSQYYSKEFGEEYKKQSGQTIDSKSLVDGLSDTGIALQYEYIANNENPLGSKHKLDYAKDNSKYSQAHKKYHPKIREFLETFGFYDVFIVDDDSGQVVYSVFKEFDFATGLVKGNYKDTTIAEAFANAKKIDDKTTATLVDFKPYTPSYEAPASFIASPIWEGDEKIGVLIFQMPIDRLNVVMGDRSGLGETGEKYLVGSDGHMRSDSYLEKERLTVVNSFRAGEKGKVQSPAIEAVLRGESGTQESRNYRGDTVFSSYEPIEILGLKWGVVVEKNLDEVLRAVRELDFAILILGALSVVFSFVWAMSFAKSLGGSIATVSTRLGEGVEAISKMAVDLSTESVKLSEAGNEQASSLQETAASIDEISAMVQRNSDSAANAASLSRASEEAAQSGKEKVGLMISSIDQIAKTQSEVNQHLDDNNTKMEEIVTIINQIADKTKIINDIVFQTKLLSFNASVEAARAGEHGKGFAVVAEEVGNLASMSGKAADEISEMLTSSTEHVRKIMAETKIKLEELSVESKESIEAGQKVSHECSQALDLILTQVATVNGKVQEIATASSEQSSGVREVNTAISQLDQVTQQNSAIAQDASARAKDLSHEVNVLQDIAASVLSLVKGAKASVQEFEKANDNPPSNLVEKTNVVKLPVKQTKITKTAKGLEASNEPHANGKEGMKRTAKVVGLSSTELPSSDDERFEDL